MLEALQNFVWKREPTLAVDTRPLDILSREGGRENSLDQLWPVNAWGVQVAPLLRLLRYRRPTAGLATVDVPSDGQESETLYWVSVNPSGFTRLHLTGGCCVERKACKRWRWVVLPQRNSESSELADEACRLCWPDLPRKGYDGSGSESAGSETEATDYSSSGESVDPSTVPPGMAPQPNPFPSTSAQV